ncbi:hypothetical protein L211DRAFT_710363 [Terfezia boudieri ATCC MYA-4762]|uniref:Uncharacterized protein n=1 Tax=Terfezia boudieri ATCC MYA-4762 TaxID=1051890 RepID=A0A3N4M080_9PEZI|nr:hypothetical protein L211DRAFT_710363 [Terfezia boudieri ATCC MYA-4762]
MNGSTFNIPLQQPNCSIFCLGFNFKPTILIWLALVIYSGAEYFPCVSLLDVSTQLTPDSLSRCRLCCAALLTPHPLGFVCI